MWNSHVDLQLVQVGVQEMEIALYFHNVFSPQITSLKLLFDPSNASCSSEIAAVILNRKIKG